MVGAAFMRRGRFFGLLYLRNNFENSQSILLEFFEVVEVAGGWLCSVSCQFFALPTPRETAGGAPRKISSFSDLKPRPGLISI